MRVEVDVLGGAVAPAVLVDDHQVPARGAGQTRDINGDEAGDVAMATLELGPC